MLNKLLQLHDQEDYDQFQKLLQHAGRTEHEARAIVLKVRLVHLRNEYRLSKAYVKMYDPEPIEWRSTLAEVLFSENPILERIPSYIRYIAMLRSEMTDTEACKILGIDRMTMWRLLRNAIAYLSSDSLDRHTSP